MELLVKEIACTVSSKHASGAIGAMRAGCQSDDDQTGVRVAKGRNGASPIRPIAIRTTPDACDFLAVTHQTRTLAALRDFAFEHDQRLLCHCASKMNSTLPPWNFSHR